MTALVWLRDDLRLADNPALVAGAEHGPVTVVYVLDEQSPGIRPLGGATRWWLHHSLASLGTDLAARGVQLVLRRGRAAEVVPEVAAEIGANAVFWNRRYALAEREIDTALKTSLRSSGIDVESFAASLLFEPWTIQTGSSTPYGVFTPFWKACLQAPVPRQPLAIPALAGSTVQASSEPLVDWKLLPTSPDWAGGLRESWTPGEPGAHERLQRFIDHGLADYADGRDFADRDVTSRLSPHLRFGEISPYQVWHAAHAVTGMPNQVNKFLSEVGWREFAWHVLFHFPDLATRNWRPQFDAFEWRPAEPSILAAWQTGNTGIDLVDAGMRELWHTGTMHNRVRMVVASLLTKNLQIDWRIGEAWFWDTLVDADSASNPFSWQWVAGSGVDAAPYFRVFNPDLQAAKFDPDGRYRERWLGAELRPAPIVDLAESRAAALAAYEVVKQARLSQ